MVAVTGTCLSGLSTSRLKRNAAKQASRHALRQSVKRHAEEERQAGSGGFLEDAWQQFRSKNVDMGPEINSTVKPMPAKGDTIRKQEDFLLGIWSDKNFFLVGSAVVAGLLVVFISMKP